MNEKELKEYTCKKVKLTLEGGFVLTGVIDAVFDDCIKFRTNQKTSLISFDGIRVLVEE